VPFWALKKLKTPRPGITQFNKIYISGLWPDSRPLARLAAVGQIRGLWLDSRPLPDSQHLAVHAGQEVQPSLAYMMHSFECVTNALAQQRDRHHPTPPPPQHITTPGPTYSNVCVFEFGFLLGGGVCGHDRILTGHSPSPSPLLPLPLQSPHESCHAVQDFAKMLGAHIQHLHCHVCREEIVEFRCWCWWWDQRIARWCAVQYCLVCWVEYEFAARGGA